MNKSKEIFRPGFLRNVVWPQFMNKT